MRKIINSKLAILDLINIGRPLNALMPLSVFILGAFLEYPSIAYSYRNLLYGALIVGFISMFATVRNDIVDYEIDADNNRQTGLHGDSYVAKDLAKEYAWYLLALAFVCVLFSGNPLICGIFALLSLVLTFVYNEKPLLFSKRPIASICCLAVCMGLLPFIFGYLLFADDLVRPLYIYILALAITLQRFSISILKDYKDVRGDRLHNKHTFLIVYGPSFNRTVSIIFSIIGYVLTMYAFSLHGINDPYKLYFLAGFSGFAFFIINLHFKLNKGIKNKYNNAIFHRILIFDTLFNISLAICFYIC